MFCWEASSDSQLADAQLVKAQTIESADPHRLADEAESLGDQFDEWFRKRVRNGRGLSLGDGIH